MFQLTKSEAEALRLQIATSKKGRGGRRSPSYVFTEQGVAMLSSVLNSEHAIEVNITISQSRSWTRGEHQKISFMHVENVWLYPTTP